MCDVMWVGWCVIVCPDAAAMLEYKLALGLVQYDVGEGNMLPVGQQNKTLVNVQR